MALAGLLALAPWAARREEEPTEGLVPFGSSPAHSFSLTVGGARSGVPLATHPSLTRPASAEDPQAGHTVMHAYGAPTVALQSQLSSIQASGPRDACPSGPPNAAPQVGTQVPPEKRLKFAAELFDLVDIDGERQLNAQKLQARQPARATPSPEC